MKKKLKEVGKVVGSIVCIIVGMSIAGFGISNFLPKKKYAEVEIEAD